MIIEMTYKQRFNIAFGFDKDEDHSMKDLKEITGIPIRILKEVYKRREGAYFHNLGSVRLTDFSKNPDLRKGANKRLSMAQWSWSRIYAFIYKSLFQNMRYKKQDTDLYDVLINWRKNIN